MEKTKIQVNKPNIVTGYSQLIEMEQLYKENSAELTDNWLLKFYSQKGEYFTVVISNAPSNNPEIPSRLKQLKFGDDKGINNDDYVKLSIAQIKAKETGYMKEGKLIPYKEDRLEIKKAEKVDEKFFARNYKDFIASQYENEITEKVQSGFSLNDAIEFFERKHRHKQSK